MAAIAGAAITGQGLFGYNWKNYFYDAKQRQLRLHQRFDIRIKRWEMFRQDIETLSDLTIMKVDNYVIVNVIKLGFFISIATEGRFPEGSPEWLVWPGILMVVGSFTYTLLSIWFAIHCSIAVHAWATKILTHDVRQPIPTDKEIEAARTHAKGYELSLV